MLRERRALRLGLGAGVYLLLWVPVLNTFFLPGWPSWRHPALTEGCQAGRSAPPAPGRLTPAPEISEPPQVSPHGRGPFAWKAAGETQCLPGTFLFDTEEWTP